MGVRRNEGTSGVEPAHGPRNITRLAGKEPGSGDSDATRDTGRNMRTLHPIILYVNDSAYLMEIGAIGRCRLDRDIGARK